MKPIYIEMKAFGSYVHERIEFDKVGHGLFLITGPTGAGKTTIFDAITYALYGKTSGSMRTEKMIHSQYAKKEMRTEVTYCFSYGNDKYTIVRKAGQEKYKRNKDGSYKKLKSDYPEEVELTLPDGKPFDGKKADINHKIEEIIKLTAAQFKQVVMLAQGEFTDLLKARSNDRQEIFMKIFDNSIYTSIEAETKKRFNEMYGSLEDTKKNIQESLQMVTIPSDSAYKEKWETLSDGFREVDKEILLDTLYQVNQEIDTKKRAMDKTISDLERQETSQRTLLKNAEELNQKFKDAEEKKKEYEAILKEDDTVRKWEQQVDKATRAQVVQTSYQMFIKGHNALKKKKSDLEQLDNDIRHSRESIDEFKEKKEKAQSVYESKGAKLTGQISTLESGYTQYEKLDGFKAQKNNMDQTIQSVRNVYASLQRSLKDKKTEVRTTEDRQQVLLKRRKDPEYFTIMIQNITDKKKQLEDLKKDLSRMASLKDSLQIKETERSAKETEKDAAYQQYNDYYQLFLSDQAALVRSSLKEGKPCPVCGSIHHASELPLHQPHATSADILYQKKTQFDTCRQQWEQLNTDCIQLNQEIQLLRQTINRNAYHDTDPDKEINICSQDIQENEKLKKQAIDDTREMAANDEKLVEQKDAIEKLEMALEANSKELQELQNQNTGLQSQIRTIQETLPCASLKEAKRQAEILQRQLESIKTNLEKAQQTYEKEYDQLNGWLAARKTMAQDLQSLEQDQAHLNKRFAKELRTQGFGSEKEFTDSILELDVIRKVRQKITEHQETKNRVQGQYHTLLDLIKGKERTDTTLLQETIQKLQTEKMGLQAQRDIVVGMMQTNRKAYERCHTLYEQYDLLHQKYEDIRDIYVVICGKTPSQHLDFKTFILRKYFKQMLAKANERLIRLSHNQFILKCVDIEDLGNRGSVGLDLNVVHLVTNEERDARSLSGGEAFMAALSMALGMADLIQLNNGSVRIDTMFIDEGFGSLSDDVRNEAVSILNELTDENRLIGIISHVNELKAQVDTKLIIDKDDQGSHHHWEY